MRSFGGGNQGMGGGGMLRNVGRVVGAGVGGVQEALSVSGSAATGPPRKSITSNRLSLSSSSPNSVASSLNLPVSATSTVPTWSSSSSYGFCDGDEWEWESVDVIEDETANGFYNRVVFGPVPSKDEVGDAVSSLQQVLAPLSSPQFIKAEYSSGSDIDTAGKVAKPTSTMNQVSSSVSELDWIEPTLHLCNPRRSQIHGYGRVYDAFHLLQTEPSVQRLVVSLSSDKAVWDAVLNNEAVRELRESLYAVEEDRPPQSSEEEPDAPTNIAKWVSDVKTRLMDLVEKITKFVNDMFQHLEKEKTTATATDDFEEKLRPSLLLTVVVLLIVVLNRAQRA